MSINRALKLLLAFTMLIFHGTNNAQENDTIPELNAYEDYANRLFISKVVEIPGKSTPELVNRFKNWAATKFVSLKDVIVNETENQIVLVYLTTLNRAYQKIMGKLYPFEVKFYVRMVVQFKDGKLRAQFYDDGNAYMNAGTVSVPTRSIFISSFIQKPTDPKELHKVTTKVHGLYYVAHCEWQDKIILMTQNFEDGMKSDSINSKKNDFDF